MTLGSMYFMGSIRKLAENTTHTRLKDSISFQSWEKRMSPVIPVTNYDKDNKARLIHGILSMTEVDKIQLKDNYRGFFMSDSHGVMSSFNDFYVVFNMRYSQIDAISLRDDSMSFKVTSNDQDSRMIANSQRKLSYHRNNKKMMCNNYEFITKEECIWSSCSDLALTV